MNMHITMETHAENYLNERRRLGFGLRNSGYAVISFARYIDALNSQEPLTVEIMADWARQDKGNSGKPSTWARRLKNLRSFCRYLQQFEPRTEVPDDNPKGIGSGGGINKDRGYQHGDYDNDEFKHVDSPLMR